MLPVELNAPSSSAITASSPPSHRAFPSFRRGLHASALAPYLAAAGAGDGDVAPSSESGSPMALHITASFSAQPSVTVRSSYVARMPFAARLTAADLEEMVQRARSPTDGSRSPSPPPLPMTSMAAALMDSNAELRPAIRALVPNDNKSTANNATAASPKVRKAAAAVVVRSPSPTEGIDLPADIKCPVCLDPFAAPVTLSCLHSVCKSHIRDLASARVKKPTDPAGDAVVVVDCPKCREATSFDNANAIRVNAEMQGIVDTMLKLLRRAAAPQATPRANVSPPKTQQGSATKNVRFLEAESESPRQPVEGAPSSNTSSNNSPSQRKAYQRLADLEKDLQKKREEAQKERERRSKEAAEEYKRERQLELDKRRAALQAAMPDVDVENDPLLRVPRSMLVDPDPNTPGLLANTIDRKWRLQEAGFLEAKRLQDERKERERIAEEERVRAGLSRWLTEASDLHSVERETQDFESRLKQAIGADVPLSRSFQRDAMRRIAEMRLPSLPSPGSAAPPEPVAPPPPPPFRDVEVELRMLDIERLAQRERDEELSRAEMAELAERRARADIERFRRAERASRGWVAPNALVDGVRDLQSRPGTSPVGSNAGYKLPDRAPAYVPKMNRVQRLS